jgi:hypothetical protein
VRRNCLLRQVIEGKIKGRLEVTGRRGRRRRRKLLDDLKERRGYSHLKEEALDRPTRRARFGRGFGPVVRQTTKWMKWIHCHAHKLQSLVPVMNLTTPAHTFPLFAPVSFILIVPFQSTSVFQVASSLHTKEYFTILDRLDGLNCWVSPGWRNNASDMSFYAFKAVQLWTPFL